MEVTAPTCPSNLATFACKPIRENLIKESLFIKTEVQSLFIFEGHTYIEVIWENFIYYYKSSYNLWLLRSNIFNKGA